jgi:hypothetical protein
MHPAPFDADLDYSNRMDLFTQLTGLTGAVLAAKFESLGNDCEFGFVQRWCGVEGLGLFRFSNPSHELIFEEIEKNFARFEDSADIELDKQEPRREWIKVNRPRRLREHTHIFEGDKPEDEVRALSINRTRLQCRLMRENMEKGRKIFVIKSGQGFLNVNNVSEIARALRRRGPNWLPWVESSVEIGRVDILTDGLAHATIDRSTVQDDGKEPSFAAWLALIAKTFLRLHDLRADCD